MNRDDFLAAKKAMDEANVPESHRRIVFIETIVATVVILFIPVLIMIAYSGIRFVIETHFLGG